MTEFTKWLDRPGGSPREMIQRQKVPARPKKLNWAVMPLWAPIGFGWLVIARTFYDEGCRTILTKEVVNRWS